MKRKFIFLVLIVSGTFFIHAQQVLPGYIGIWENNVLFSVLDLIGYYPDQLPFIRNEIYARYGRPFATQIYRDYFRAKSWYQEKSNFSDSWLSQTDRENAELILSLEQSISNADQVVTRILRNIEYTDGQAVLTFTSRSDVVWIDRRVNFNFYGLSGSSQQHLSWTILGDWVFLYERNYWSGYSVVAYRMDHAAKKVIGPADWLEFTADYFEKFLVSVGGRILE